MELNDPCFPRDCWLAPIFNRLFARPKQLPPLSQTHTHTHTNTHTAAHDDVGPTSSASLVADAEATVKASPGVCVSRYFCARIWGQKESSMSRKATVKALPGVCVALFLCKDLGAEGIINGPQ